MGVLLGQLLGPGEVGLYFQALAFHEFALLAAVGGFRLAVTRFVAIHEASGDRARVQGIVRLGLRSATLLGAFLGLTLFLAGDWMSAEVFHDPRLADPLRLVAIALPFSVFADVTLAATRGYRTMRPYATIGLLFQSGGRLVFTIAFLVMGLGLEGTLLALVVTNVIAVGLAWRALRRLMGTFSGAAIYEPRSLFAFSLATWGTSVAMYALTWGDTLLIGIIEDSASVGLYQVSTRIVLLSAIFVVPLGAAFAPRIADLIARGRNDVLDATYKSVSGWLLKLSIAPALILLLFPEDLLSIFGPEFPAGADVTRILAWGAVIHASTGPADQMLIMGGHPRRVLYVNLTAMAADLGLNLLLIPAYGIEGAATAWLIALTIMNASLALQVRTAMGMQPVGVGHAKALAAGAVAGLVGFLLVHPIGAPFWLGLPAVVVTYGGLLALAGLTAEDRLILGLVRDRVKGLAARA